MLFRMVPKHIRVKPGIDISFRAVLFRMVPKRELKNIEQSECFRAVLFRKIHDVIIFVEEFRAICRT